MHARKAHTFRRPLNAAGDKAKNFIGFLFFGDCEVNFCVPEICANFSLLVFAYMYSVANVYILFFHFLYFCSLYLLICSTLYQSFYFMPPIHLILFIIWLKLKREMHGAGEWIDDKKIHPAVNSPSSTLVIYIKK